MKKITVGIAGVAVLVGAAFAWTAVAQSPSKRPVAKVVTNTVDAKKSTSVPAGGSEVADPTGAPEIVINREAYVYASAGRRDPFRSLMNSTDLRPHLSDLKLVAVAYDPVGSNSVAVLRDVPNSEQYRVRAGQTLGRMRVVSIQEKRVVFAIDEFGYSRQEALAISDSTKVRTQ